jgi:hypothetical protein
VPPTLVNNTRLNLSGVAVIRRRLARNESQPDEQTLVDEAAWIGALPPGGKAAVHFKLYKDAEAEIAAGRRKSPVTSKDRPEGVLSLRRLVELAENPAQLAAGDVRLVAWYDQGLPGVRVDPAAAQARRATLVVGNLVFGSLPVVPDENLAQERPAAE